MTETGTYLYAVGKQTPWLPDVNGVADAAVRTLPRSGLVAYVSTVSLDEFGEAAARRNMEDLSWLERMARAHDRVVEAITRQTPTAPVRFLAVYAGDARVQDLLDRKYEDFATVLDSVTGRTEWGVKVYADPAALTAPDAGSGESDKEGGEKPGTAYLLRRKAASRRREDVQSEATAKAEGIFQSLSKVASASRRHRPQDPRLSGRNDWMVLNAAYLVDDERNDEFAAAVAAIEVDGFDVELTGPWAPYSFTDIDLSTPDQETPR